MACQICLETYDTLIIDGVANSVKRVQNLCGVESCTVDVCSSCLAEHIMTAVRECPTGTLPRVRCPICLTRINQTDWVGFVDNSVMHQYHGLARTALGFRTPCCDDSSYSHLPFPDNSIPDAEKLANLTPLGFDSERAMRLSHLLVDFNNFKTDASDVLRFIVAPDSSQNAVETVIEYILPRLVDGERRATLYLAYLYHYSEIYTRCCGYWLCFTCKGEHGDGSCDSDESFSMEDCVVRCRGCRVMLVKTEGCESVVCLCGFTMTWPDEIQFRKLHKRQLLPVDIYDGQRMDLYVNSKKVIAQLPTRFEAWRKKHVDRLIREYESSLQKIAIKVRERRLFKSPVKEDPIETAQVST